MPGGQGGRREVVPAAEPWFLFKEIGMKILSSGVSAVRRFGLDAAAFWTDDVPGTNRVLRFWLTGWYTMLDNSEYWMTPQFRDPNP
jgi:hypothetical protein